MPPGSTVTRMRAAPEIAVMAGFPQNAFESARDSVRNRFERMLCALFGERSRSCRPFGQHLPPR